MPDRMTGTYKEVVLSAGCKFFSYQLSFEDIVASD